MSTSDYDGLVESLTKVREERVCAPELVYQQGFHLLSKHPRRLSLDALWALREEVAIAALHVGEVERAGQLIELIVKQFGGSVRAYRLMGMHLEAIKDYEKAEYLYSKALVKHPQNPTILHRIVALKVSRGDIPGALQELNEHLKVHMTDIAAWEQAASLYLQLGQVQQAIFCLEEVVMHQPGNLNALLLLADSLYSLGGEKNVSTAQKVYSGIIEVTNGNHVRALYGLCLCASQLSTATSSSSGLKKGGKSVVKSQPSALGSLAADALLQQYALKNSPRVPLVRAMLISQNLLPAPDTR